MNNNSGIIITEPQSINEIIKIDTKDVNFEIKGNKISVSSLDVAKIFEKNHRDVLRVIKDFKNDLNMKNFNERNFALVNYKDAKGEVRPAYNLTRDGFSLLAMGFNGKKALQFKVAFINAFNQMEQELKENAIPLNSLKGLFEYMDVNDNTGMQFLRGVSHSSIGVDCKNILIEIPYKSKSARVYFSSKVF